MKTIEVDDQLYFYIASQTQHIGESASDILRRLLDVQQRGLSVADPPKPAMPPSPAGLNDGSGGRSHFAALSRLLESEKFTRENRAVGRFMLILATLYQLDGSAFTSATEIKGRKRVYFARSEEQLLEHGASTKPRQIPASPYWVITNTNTGRKRSIIAQLMTDLGYCHAQIEQITQAI